MIEIFASYAGFAALISVVALATSIHVIRWRRRSHTEWRAYDAAHDDDPPWRYSRAALRARGERRR